MLLPVIHSPPSIANWIPEIALDLSDAFPLIVFPVTDRDFYLGRIIVDKEQTGYHVCLERVFVCV